jgi:hypothetical protein
MLVVAHHFVEKMEFWSKAKEVADSLPAGFKILSILPSKDMKTGTCIWEAPDVNSLQTFLDENSVGLVKNVCYEVEESMAMGLPQHAMEAAF